VCECACVYECVRVCVCASMGVGMDVGVGSYLYVSGGRGRGCGCEQSTFLGCLVLMMAFRHKVGQLGAQGCRFTERQSYATSFSCNFVQFRATLCNERHLRGDNEELACQCISSIKQSANHICWIVTKIRTVSAPPSFLREGSYSLYRGPGKTHLHEHTFCTILCH
jgi:hypothetical protein